MLFPFYIIRFHITLCIFLLALSVGFFVMVTEGCGTHYFDVQLGRLLEQQYRVHDMHLV